MRKGFYLFFIICIVGLFSSCGKEVIYRDYHHYYNYPIQTELIHISKDMWQDDGASLFCEMNIPKLTNTILLNGKMEVYMEEFNGGSVSAVIPLPDIFTKIDTDQAGNETFFTRFIRFEIFSNSNGINSIKFIEETTDLRFIAPENRVDRFFRVVLTEPVPR